MTDVRRSLFLVSMERYTCAAITFLSLAVTSRLLSAREIGVAMLGAGIIGVLETLRECGASTFLIQHKNLMLENIRTAFTVMLGITFALIAIVWLAARPIALWFGSEAVEGYLHLAIVGLLYGPFISTVSALFRRDMAFGKLALIAIVCSIVQAATLIVLAIRGFGSMSFAWGGLSYGFCGTMMIFLLGADPSYFKPSLKGWRQSLSFAAYDSASALLNRAWEILPTFVFARTLGVDAVGLYSRATSVCQWPEKILFAGIGPVLLPAFASGARAGHSLKAAYLRALEYVTVLQWPALVMLILLAHPIVLLVLGEKWLATVPLVQLISGAMLLWFPAYLTYPSLVAAGAIRDALRSSLISLPISAAVLCLMAPFGLTAVASSMFVIIPVQAGVSLALVKRHVNFTAREFLMALRNSVIVTAFSATGPLIWMAVSDFRSPTAPVDALLIACLGGLGWLFGVWYAGHPILHELLKVKAALSTRLSAYRSGSLPAR